MPTSLDTVGTVYWETESTNNDMYGPATFDSSPGLCTYVSPPKGMAVVCPANDAGVVLDSWDGVVNGVSSLPMTLWAPAHYSFTEAQAQIPCTYAGWDWRPGTTANG